MTHVAIAPVTCSNPDHAGLPTNQPYVLDPDCPAVGSMPTDPELAAQAKAKVEHWFDQLPLEAQVHIWQFCENVQEMRRNPNLTADDVLFAANH